MARMNKNGTVRPAGRGGAKYALLAFVLGGVALIIGVGAFFRVTQMVVTGMSVYTEQEVIAASGVEYGDNVVFLDESGAVIRIQNSLTYVDEVKIIKRLPGTVEIRITECYPVGKINTQGSWWIIDKNGKVLEEAKAAGKWDVPEIVGLKIESPEVGKTLTFVSGNENQQQNLKTILGSIMQMEITANVDKVDLSVAGNITLSYEGRITVELGGGGSLDSKIQLLVNVLTQLESGAKGTLDLSKENQAHFIRE